MNIAVQDKDGNIYTNDIIHGNKQVIDQVKIVNGEGETITFLTKNIDIPSKRDAMEFHLDMLAVENNEVGEWFQGEVYG